MAANKFRFPSNWLKIDEKEFCWLWEAMIDFIDFDVHVSDKFLVILFHHRCGVQVFRIRTTHTKDT